MHDDHLDAATGDFLAELRATFAGDAPPAAGDGLVAFFAGVAPHPSAAPTGGRSLPRRRPVFLEVLKSLPSKVAATGLGVMIGVAGLGAAGALPGSMMLTSNDSEVAAAPCAPEEEGEEIEAAEEETSETDTETESAEPAEGTGEATETDPETEECESEEAGEGEDDAEDAGDTEVEDGAEEGEDAEDAEEPVDVTSLADVPVPSRQSEAAKTHAFDEACGNHGKYVSHFARYGEEPECATAARAAASDEAQAAPDATATTDDDSEEGGEQARNNGQAKKAEASKGKPAHAGGKGKGGRR